jgi:hypothetical protein
MKKSLTPLEIQKKFGKRYNYETLHLNSQNEKIPRWIVNVITACVWNGCSSNSGSTARFIFSDNTEIEDISFISQCLAEAGISKAAKLIAKYKDLKIKFLEKEKRYIEHMDNCENEDCKLCVKYESYIEDYVDFVGKKESQESEVEADAILSQYIRDNAG